MLPGALVFEQTPLRSGGAPGTDESHGVEHVAQAHRTPESSAPGADEDVCVGSRTFVSASSASSAFGER
jgi:hypothetical protein